MIGFTIPGEPQALQRHRHGNGRTYDTAANKTNKATIQHYALEAFREWEGYDGRIIEMPILMFIEAYMQRPKSHFSTARGKRGEVKPAFLHTMPTKTPDLDNIAKLIGDAAEGVIYKNDAQIVYLGIRKRWADYMPKTFVEINLLKGSV